MGAISGNGVSIEEALPLDGSRPLTGPLQLLTTDGALKFGANTHLQQDGANHVLAQRNGTNAQTFNLYNTFTDASNFERVGIKYDTDVITFASEAAGTGTARDFQFTGGALTCETFTSTGIDDNTTGERLQLTDSVFTVGAAGSTLDVVLAADDTNIAISGGSSAGSGGNILMFGGTHATLANDIRFRGGSTSQLVYDDSASTWDFQLNQAILDQSTADNGFIDFQATIDADATSAISSLTTSGAVTNHIQFKINGTTFWIAGSTTDPS